jgi:hypothetical protein
MVPVFPLFHRSLVRWLIFQWIRHRLTIISEHWRTFVTSVSQPFDGVSFEAAGGLRDTSFAHSSDLIQRTEMPSPIQQACV